MANPDHVDRLWKQDVLAWNKWREDNPTAIPNLSDADLEEIELLPIMTNEGYVGINLKGVNLEGAKLQKAKLDRANLQKAILNGADLRDAELVWAKFTGAKLRAVHLSNADLRFANLTRTDLSDGKLMGAKLIRSKFNGANLKNAQLSGAYLSRAEFNNANLTKADLQATVLIKTDLCEAELSGARIYGISAWDVKMDEKTKQQDLVITPEFQPVITVDDLEVAQFIYSLLDNRRLRRVIDVMTSKMVLVLGNFADERKAVLDKIKEWLRYKNYLPVLFDFPGPDSRDISETIELLYRMSGFIIADMTDPRSVPYEVQKDVLIPFQPIIKAGQSLPATFMAVQRTRHWMLPVHEYDDIDGLFAAFETKLLPAIKQENKKLLQMRANDAQKPGQEEKDQ